MSALMTGQEREQLLANGRQRLHDATFDPWPVVRLFTPDAHAIWLLAALAADDDTAWGVCDLGIGLPALGEVCLKALSSIRGPQSQPVLRDRSFVASRPLSAYLRQAEDSGSLQD